MNKSQPQGNDTPIEDLLQQLTDADSEEVHTAKGHGNNATNGLALLDALGITAPPKEVVTADDSVAWADNQLRLLGTIAVRQLHRLLIYGSDKIVAETAKDVLNRIGLKEDKTNKAAPPVIVLLPESVANLPWNVKKQLQENVIDGQLVEATNAEK